MNIGYRIKIVNKDKFLKGLDFKGELIPVEKEILQQAEEICEQEGIIIDIIDLKGILGYKVEVNNKQYMVYERDFAYSTN